VPNSLQKHLKNIFSAELTAKQIEQNFSADFFLQKIGKEISVLISLKKISTADFIEKQIRPPNLTPLLISLQKN